MKNKTKSMISTCMICDSPMGLTLMFESIDGKKFLCQECAKHLYTEIGKKLIPASPKNLFRTKK